jgi:hypothetical protein
VWYELSIVAASWLPNFPGKHAVWIPNTSVANSSKMPPAGYLRPQAVGDRIPRFLDFTGCNFNPLFNPKQHTYQFALGGAIHSWRFPNGTNTQKAAALPASGWKLTLTRELIKWSGPVDVGGTPGTATFVLQWNVESVNLRLTLVWGSQSEDLYYRPADSGDYVQNTVSSQHGAMSWATRGVFNGDGTTVFHPAASILSDARKTPGLASFGAEVPDTITLTRVNQ